jgi:hypothetical protein
MTTAGVLHESMFGSTHRIAEANGEELANHAIVRAGICRSLRSRGRGPRRSRRSDPRTLTASLDVSGRRPPAVPMTPRDVDGRQCRKRGRNESR